MINPRELRIGNYVLAYGKKVVEVTSLDLLDDVPNIGEYYLDTVSPIPLTEEWLLKFGFENNGHQFNLDVDQCLLAWSSIGLMYFVGEEGQHLPHIKHVHQLQNLYFALTGEELACTVQ